MALIAKTVSCSIVGLNPPANYFWTNSGLVDAGYTSTSFGTINANGTVSVDFQYETLTPENGTLTLTVIDAVCTQVRNFSYVYNLPVSFTQTSPFTCFGGGGGNWQITSGEVTLGLLLNGDIPSNYTVSFKVDGVVQSIPDYSVTWNGTNYIVAGVSLGGVVVLPGVRVISIEVFEISTNTTYSANFNSTSCP